MYFVTFDVDGREGTRRTDVLTGSAANAGSLVDSRNHGRFLIILVKGHHLDGTSGTVTGTVAALHLIGNGHTILLDPYGMTYLDRGFLVLVDFHYSTCRTDFRAARTLRTAVPQFIRHDRQHQVHQVAAGTEHLIGTFRHAELTTCTVLGEMVERE